VKTELKKSDVRDFQDERKLADSTSAGKRFARGRKCQGGWWNTHTHTKTRLRVGSPRNNFIRVIRKALFLERTYSDEQKDQAEAGSKSVHHQKRGETERGEGEKRINTKGESQHS
jgi:hypothetical protein